MSASLYCTRTATFDYDARAGCAGIDGVQYSTSQSALLRLPAHFRQIGQLVRSLVRRV